MFQTGAERYACLNKILTVAVGEGLPPNIARYLDRLALRQPGHQFRRSMPHPGVSNVDKYTVIPFQGNSDARLLVYYG
jgi:hypothetical protein